MHWNQSFVLGETLLKKYFYCNKECKKWIFSTIFLLYFKILPYIKQRSFIMTCWVSSRLVTFYQTYKAVFYIQIAVICATKRDVRISVNLKIMTEDFILWYIEVKLFSQKWSNLLITQCLSFDGKVSVIV